MLKLFRKKKEKKITDVDLVNLLIKYIEASRERGISEEEILTKINEKGYRKELIRLSFDIAGVKGGKMAKKKKLIDEEYEDEEEETEDEDEDEEEETEDEKPKKVKPVTKTQKLTEEQKDAILANHETRIREIEATLFRLKSI